MQPPAHLFLVFLVPRCTRATVEDTRRCYFGDLACMAGIAVSYSAPYCVPRTRCRDFFAHPQRNPQARPCDPFAFSRRSPTATKWQ